jgi:hypothetical protein
MVETGALVSRVYSGFRGVDFRGEEVALNRSPDSLNMWRNRKKTAGIETRPALERVLSCGTVYGIYFFKGKMIVHSGTQLLIVSEGTSTVLKSGVNAARSNGFVYGEVWYFLDGKNYLQYDGKSIKSVVGFIPTTSISRKALSGGEVFQDVNLIQSKRINTFLGDGKSTMFLLDAKDIDSDFVPIVKLNGEVFVQEPETWAIDYKTGRLQFWEAPPEPLTPGQDNISVEFSKTDSAGKKKILGCTLAQVFDNRVFFSGNPDYPNFVWHCGLDDPSYWGDTDYYREGMDSAKITGMVAGNNALWVFREPSDSNTSVFYHVPTTDDDYGKIYPSAHSSVTLGCVGKAINFGDDIVFFSERGMEGISGDITTEQFAAHRSTLVDGKLLKNADYKNMLLEEWEGYLLIFVGSEVFLADSIAILTNENHNEYEFFYWDLNKRVTASKVSNGILYIGTEDGVYTLTDTDGAVESYWTTPKDKFQAPQKQKTTNKKGCVVEAEGEVTVSAKTNSSEFETIGTYDSKDFSTVRVKLKKWKDIQLKFYSPTGFSIEQATLEAFVGGYLKR